MVKAREVFTIQPLLRIKDVMKSLIRVILQAAKEVGKQTGDDATASALGWWEARRWRYNKGLVIAGLLAFVGYAVVGFTFLTDDQEFEITGLTTLVQGIGYLFMMGVANVCYCLGALSERGVEPAELEKHRQRHFRLGFWFSVLLPFSIPVLLLLVHA